MITSLFKLLVNLIRLAVIFLVAALIFHTWVIRQTLKTTLSWGLGAPVEIRAVKMDWRNTGFEIQDLEIGNPYHYPAGLLADIPLAIVSVDITKIPEGVLHFKTVGFNLRELVVTHSPGKGMNVMELKAIKEAKAPERGMTELGTFPERHQPRMMRAEIDELIVSIGTITFIETLTGVQKQKRIHANIQGQTFYNLSGSGDIAHIVVTLVMKKLGYNFAADSLARFMGDQGSGAVNQNLLDKVKSIIF